MNHKQIEILESLAKYEPLSGFQVAEATGQWKGLIHGRLANLIDLGYVEGYWVSHDKYQDLKIRHYKLTETGRRHLLIQSQGYKPYPA